MKDNIIQVVQEQNLTVAKVFSIILKDLEHLIDKNRLFINIHMNPSDYKKLNDDVDKQKDQFQVFGNNVQNNINEWSQMKDKFRNLLQHPDVTKVDINDKDNEVFKNLDVYYKVVFDFFQRCSKERQQIVEQIEILWNDVVGKGLSKLLADTYKKRIDILTSELNNNKIVIEKNNSVMQRISDLNSALSNSNENDSIYYTTGHKNVIRNCIRDTHSCYEFLQDIIMRLIYPKEELISKEDNQKTEIGAFGETLKQIKSLYTPKKYRICIKVMESNFKKVDKALEDLVNTNKLFEDSCDMLCVFLSKIDAYYDEMKKECNNYSKKDDIYK